MIRPTTRAAAVLLLTSGAAGCAPDAGGPSRAAVENEITARTLMTLWGSGDSRTLPGLFFPDAVYEDFANQAQYRGVEEIVGYVNGGWDWASALDVAVLAVHASETGATVEWVLAGIQDAPIGSRVPVATGREVVVNGVTVLEIQDGRIRRGADYYDWLTMVLQLGGQARLPGGSVLELDPPPPGADPGVEDVP